MKVGVLGAGVMGKRIALLVAAGGHEVVLWNYDIRDATMKELKRESRLWKLDFKEVSKNITFTYALEDLDKVDYVIESVVEDFEKKAAALRDVSLVVGQDVVIATNTSSLSISALADSVASPSRFHGLHFFNPPQKMRFVEVACSHLTSDRALQATSRLLDDMMISSINVPDVPGFVVNHLLFTLINLAIALIHEHQMEAADIDLAMRTGANHPMGPLQLADFIGLDTCLEILDNLHQRTGNLIYRPPELLHELVEKNELGKKTGKGFYCYH